jgi:hypothetical protein
MANELTARYVPPGGHEMLQLDSVLWAMTVAGPRWETRWRCGISAGAVLPGPDAFSTDPDRLARFEREARTLATLNHPNIAQIYGVEESGGVRALVMELVDGPTLDEFAAGARHSAPAATGPAAMTQRQHGMIPTSLSLPRMVCSRAATAEHPSQVGSCFYNRGHRCR